MAESNEVPTIPALSDVIAAVKEDCRQGLALLVWTTKDSLEVFTPSDNPSDRLGNSTHTVVSWQTKAIHGTDDQPLDVWSTDRPMRSKLTRTERVVSVRGVTIVGHADPDPANWTFERHVDWNGLASQIGVAMGCLASDPIQQDSARI